MSIDAQDAVDEMFSTVKQVNDGSSVAIFGYVPEIRWPGQALATKPDMTKHWMRASQQLVTDEQIAFASVDETRLFEAIGLLYVQLFCPRNAAATVENGLLLANIIADAFRQQSISGEIIYRKAKVVQLPETSESYPINVVVQFEYKTIHSKNFNGTLPGEDMNGTLVTGEIPSGGPTVYTLLNMPLVGSVAVYINGYRQNVGTGNDYTLVGKTLTILSPVTIQEILVDYRF